MTDTEKIRENRLRRAAERQGYKLVKSKRRDPRAIGYGGWTIANVATGKVEAGANGFINVDEVERFLNGENAPAQ